MTDDAYPVAHVDGDERFTFALVHDFTALLKEHGYPSPATNLDRARLSQGLYKAIYTDSTYSFDPDARH